MKRALLALMISIIIISCTKPIAIINYSFIGCMASGKATVELYKVDGATMAKLERKDSITLHATLNSAQVDSFLLFVSELRDQDEKGGCTTEEKYIVCLNDETIKKTIRNCNWNGFGKLIEDLFQKRFYY